jgi:predicted DNA-binding transcriptional regulator AlpA
MTSRQRTPREEVLRRSFELPWEDLYEVWRVVGLYLEPAGARETKVSKQLRERAEAVDCLRRAAERLGLSPDEAPTIEQYKGVRGELGLPLSARQIELRWESWQFATLALTGERPVETSAQRSLRRAASGRRYGHEEYLAGVREWLDGPPKPASRTTKDYDEWAKRRNETSEDRPVVLTSGVEAGLTLPWHLALRVAKFELELDEAQRLRLEELTTASGPLRLISLGGVALIYKTGRSYANDLVRRTGFPPPVAVIAGSKVWYRKDVEAHQAGRKVRRRAGELQEQLVGSGEYSRRTGWTKATIHGLVHSETPSVLRPAGSVSGRTFWLRKDFEAWLVERERRLLERDKRRDTVKRRGRVPVPG